MVQSLHAPRNLRCPHEMPSFSWYPNEYGVVLRVVADSSGLRRYENVAVRVDTTRNFTTIKIPAILWTETLGSISEYIVFHAQVLQETAANMINTELNLPLAIENAFANCEYTTFLAVDGSLMGSALCLLGICRFLSNSYLRRFEFLSRKPVGIHHCIFKMIQAFDIILLGSAMIVFGFGTYPVFMPTGTIHAQSSLVKVGYRNILSKLKSKIGNIVLSTLQVGFLEKLKHLEMVRGDHLSSLLATVLVLSVTLFLSRPSRHIHRGK